MLRPANVAESTYDPGVEYSLEYIDEDGDTILVSNQDHLDVALRLLPTGNKLKLTSRQKVSETPPGAVTVEHVPPQQQQLDQPAGGAVNIEAELPKQSATTTRGHRGRRIMASTGTRNGASASKALAASGPVTTVTTKRTRSAAAKSKAADDVAAATNLFSARKS